MRLTRQAIEHAQQRLEQITRQKINEKTSKLKPLSEEPEMSYAERYSQIKSGKAKLKPFSEWNSYTKFYDCYEFPEFKKLLDKYNAEKEKREKEIELIESACRQSRDLVMDKIMFSDAQEALNAIEAFAKQK